MLAAQVGQATLGQSAVLVQDLAAAAAALLAVAGLPVLGLAEPAAAGAEEGLLVAVGPAVLRAALAKPTAAGAGSGSSRALGHVASAASLRRQSTNPSSCHCCQAKRD